MTQRTAARMATILWLLGLLALALALYLVGADRIPAGAKLAIAGIVLEGSAGVLLIWYAL